ncbi:MAG: hypothetical protein ACE5GE_07825 [Phycisphaerae bacterium]
MRKRYLAEAWDWFQRREYQRARSSFKNAELLDRTDLEPRVGIFFCCVAEQEYYLASYNMGRLLRWDGLSGEMFDTDFQIVKRLESLDEPDARQRARMAARHASEQMNAMMQFAAHNANQEIAFTALSFGLWHMGYFTEAAQAAKTLQELDPDSPYAQFGGKLMEALERRKAAGRTQ